MVVADAAVIRPFVSAAVEGTTTVRNRDADEHAVVVAGAVRPSRR